MKTIYDLFDAPAIAAYYAEAVTNREAYLGEALFTNRKQIGLDLTWFRGYKGAPVSLKPAAFDADARIRDRVGLSKAMTEMPFFREAMRLGEKDRQELNKVLSGMNASFVKPIIDNIYDDIKNLVESALVSAERMRMQLLSTGEIAIAADGKAYDYDYKFPSANREVLKGQNAWTDFANSQPIKDIRRWQKKIRDKTGIKPSRAICSTDTFDLLMASESIRYDMNVRDGDRLILTESEVMSYLSRKLDGFEIYLYDKVFSPILHAQTQQFFPNGVFTLLPPGRIGETVFGTTPEESDLMAGNTYAKVSVVETGVAITSYVEPHPVNRVNIVSAIVLPTFEAIDGTFIATVGPVSV